VPNHLVAAFLSITGFEEEVGHVTGGSSLLSKRSFRQDDWCINLIIRFHLDDDILTIFLLKQEIRVVAANGMGLRVDVLDEKV
jgi:hypothetical protein